MTNPISEDKKPFRYFSTFSGIGGFEIDKTYYDYMKGLGL